MLEWNSFFVTDQGCSTLQLRQYGVASIAVLWNHFAICADVLPVVTSETARRVEVADVVGVRPPVHFHVGKDRGLIDVLKIGNGGLDRGSLAGAHIGVLGAIELLYVFGNPSQRFVSSVVALGDADTPCCLMKGNDLSIRPASKESSTERSGGVKIWLGRSWQSMQSIRCLVAFSICSGVRLELFPTYTVVLPCMSVA